MYFPTGLEASNRSGFRKVPRSTTRILTAISRELIGKCAAPSPAANDDYVVVLLKWLMTGSIVLIHLARLIYQGPSQKQASAL